MTPAIKAAAPAEAVFSIFVIGVEKSTLALIQGIKYNKNNNSVNTLI
jgi:hypothetical protein